MRTLLAALLVLFPPVPGDVIDRIMAVAGTQPITLSEVAAATQLELVPVPAGTKDATGFVLDRLIDRTFMLVEVDRFQPPEPDPIEITSRIERMQARIGSAEAFDKALAVTGTTREQLQRFIRDNLRMQTYINQRFGTLLDPVERDESIAAWVRELRRRAQVTVLYRPAPPKL
jgi:hypothetical protein